MLITSTGSKFIKRKRSITLNGKVIEFEKPVVMGILNITPNSFFDGGRYTNEKDILLHVEEMIEEGANIIDVGAVSTHPGAEMVSTKEELSRLLPVLKSIKNRFPDVPLSIDTFRSWVAMEAMDLVGECIVNDISGGNFDENMFITVAKLGVPYILMHIVGTPQTMQDNPHYDDIVRDISSYFSEKVRLLTRAGVKDVILDPGFGFGKSVDDNYELLNRLDSFKVFQLPVLAGISRKSMIFKLLGITPEESLPGTEMLNTMALLGGSDILRVHDVKEAVQAVKIFEELKKVANK